MRSARLFLALSLAASCYGTPRAHAPEDDASAGNSGTGGGGAGTAGGPAGSGGVAGAVAGGAPGTGMAGTDGSGTGGSSTVFVGGPCVVSIPGSMAVEVFARSAGSIFRRRFDGRNWETWTALTGLDGRKIDARSDLDCAASVDTVHIVAAGLDPVGALEHAFGFGTNYNPFVRELSPNLAAQSPSVALLSNTARYFGWAASGQLPGLFYVETSASAVALTPITSMANDLVSAADISPQQNAIYFAAFDSDGKLAIYVHNMSSGGSMWIDATKIESPGFFAFSPAVCAESGLSGSYSVNVAAVTGHDLWFSGTDRVSGWPQFSTWTKIGTDAASSPDCAVFAREPGSRPDHPHRDAQLAWQCHRSRRQRHKLGNDRSRSAALARIAETRALRDR